jgi:hypothetical protein
MDSFLLQEEYPELEDERVAAELLLESVFASIARTTAPLTEPGEAAARGASPTLCDRSLPDQWLSDRLLQVD